VFQFYEGELAAERAFTFVDARGRCGGDFQPSRPVRARAKASTDRAAAGEIGGDDLHRPDAGRERRDQRGVQSSGESQVILPAPVAGVDGFGVRIQARFRGPVFGWFFSALATCEVISISFRGPASLRSGGTEARAAAFDGK
jgi:hypothetical protein